MRCVVGGYPQVAWSAKNARKACVSALKEQAWWLSSGTFFSNLDSAGGCLFSGCKPNSKCKHTVSYVKQSMLTKRHPKKQALNESQWPTHFLKGTSITEVREILTLALNSRYQHYLESVLEGADEYQEVPDLLMRHATLRATNKDLRDHQQKCR
eukprot:scaffold89026_cov19-Tisochrysis_lutea.AAC.1